MDERAAPCDAVPNVKLMKRIKVPILRNLYKIQNFTKSS